MESGQQQAEALGVLGGDRLCSACGFNLIGQRLEREATYGLIITRCPECGAVAPMLTYPLMTRWVNRWRMLLAVVWVGLLIAAVVGHMFVLARGSLSLSNQIGIPLAIEIGQAYVDDMKAAGNEIQAPKVYGTDHVILQWVTFTLDWYESTAKGLLDASSPWSMYFRKSTLLLMLPQAVLSVGLGMFWSVVLLGSRRRWVIFVPAVSAVGGILIAIGERGYTRMYSWQSFYIVGYYLQIRTLVFLVLLCTPFVLLGIYTGRSFARLVLTVSLPPRMRGLFAWLWIRDGLLPPRTRLV